ncbi:MAG TPA: TolC family protein [Myxococcota bacterium]|nr:TolC family protein [Myxococcota bacterium]
MLVRSLVFVLPLALAAPIAATAQNEQQQPAPKINAIENPNLPPPPEVQPTPPAPALEPPTEPQITEPETVPAQPPSGGNQAPMIHGKLALSLEDALKMGLENNLDVQVQRYSPLIADMDQKIAWGAYEPTSYAEMGYSDSQIPNSNILFGTKESINKSTDGFGGLRGLLPWLNTEYTAEFDSARLETNSAIEAQSPKYTSGWHVGITQPLLRDLIWNQPWTQIKTSRLVFESSQEGFRSNVMDTVRSIEDAYWTLIATKEAERVAEKSLETAKALLAQTRTQFEVGVVSKVEVTEAEAGLSQREVTLIRARNDYRNQQDRLIDLVLGKGLRASSTLELDPTDNPVDIIAYEIELEQAVARAFENRPEVQQAQKEIQRQQVLLAFAKNQRLPALDGIFTYGQNGLSGHGSRDFATCEFLPTTPGCPGPVPPPADQGNYGDNFNDYEHSPSYSARARFSIPIPNTAASRNVDRTEFELGRAETSLHRLEQSIILEVREAARNLAASQEGIVAAQDARRAADEQLRAERIRLEYGESTPFDVLLREEQLVDRERELIFAYQAYHLSVTGLDRAQGTILRNRNISIADVAPLR